MLIYTLSVGGNVSENLKRGKKSQLIEGDSPMWIDDGDDNFHETIFICACHVIFVATQEADKSEI